MPLVAYDNSDSSDFEDDEKYTNATISSVTLKEEDINSKRLSNDIFKSLLPPNRMKFQPIEEEDDEFLHKKASDIKPKTKILVPSLSDFKDVECISQNKPKGANGKKSGLLTLLPDPKNGVKMTIKSLIPHAVSKKSNIHPVNKLLPNPAPKTKNPIEGKSAHNLAVDYSDEESENEDGNDFFSINKIHEVVEEPIETVAKGTCDVTSDVDSRFNETENVFVNQDNEDDMLSKPDYIELTNSTENNELQLDEEAIRQLCGSRGRRKREEIQILNINQQEVLDDAKEMLMKNIMDESQPTRTSAKRKGSGPTSQQKRKHQITYLAYQAKANEAELQNQWAQNRVSKRQTQSKYGF